jgi:hypothetical protein
VLKEYINDAWLPILQHNHLESFEALWELNKDDWFEPPNYGEVAGAVSSEQVSLSLRAETSGFSSSVRKITSFAHGEISSGSRPLSKRVQKYSQLSQAWRPTLEPIYYCQKTVAGKLRAIVVTRELAGYQPFDASVTDRSTR